MRGHNRWLLAAGLAIGTLGMASIANAQAALDSTFSYQGQLKSGLNLVEVNSDFRFTVWDSSAGGVQIAGPVTRSNVLVRDGVFSVSLDFGTAPFNGENRFLQIEVRSPAGVGAFTTLTPRQKMQATPYALQAQSGNAPFVVRAPGSTNNITINPENAGFFGGATSSTFGGKLAQTTGAVNGGAGILLNFNLAQGTVSSMLGADAASGSGFLQLNERDPFLSFGTVFLNADDDRNDANGIYEGSLNLFSRGTGGTGGIVRLLSNGGGSTLEARGGITGGGANINFFSGTTGKRILSLSENIGGSKPGGRLSASRPNESEFFFLEPDFDGPGGFFALFGGSGGLTVDGNAGATGGPRLSVNGPVSSMNFDTNTAGNGSVNLPANAISAGEILDEPGVANNRADSAVILASGAVGTLISRSITVPGPGFVVVLANGDISISHTTGTVSNYAYGVSDSATSLPSDQDIQSVVQSHEPTTFYDYSAAAHGLFTVSGAGTFTYYFNALKFTGAGTARMFDINLTIMYFPTAYGATVSNFTGSFAPNTGNTGPFMGVVTGEQIMAERAQGEQFGRDRAMAELAQMQARIQQLQKMIGNGPATPAAVAPAKKNDTRPAVEPVAINNSEGK